MYDKRNGDLVSFKNILKTTIEKKTKRNKRTPQPVITIVLEFHN